MYTYSYENLSNKNVKTWYQIKKFYAFYNVEGKFFFFLTHAALLFVITPSLS